MATQPFSGPLVASLYQSRAGPVAAAVAEPPPESLADRLERTYWDMIGDMLELAGGRLRPRRRSRRAA